MVKRRGVKRNVSRKVSRIPQQSSNNSTYVALGVAVFLIAVLALGFVDVSSTGNAVSIQGDNNVVICADGSRVSTPDECPGGRVRSIDSGSSGGGFFDRWNAGTLDAEIAKYIFFILVFAVLMGVVRGIGVPQNFFLQFIIATGMSFLAVAYITPDEIYGLLVSYSALGLTVGAILPFFAIAAISIMILTVKSKRTQGVGPMVVRIFLELMLWWLFLFYLGYKFVKAYGDQNVDQWVAGGPLILIGLIILTLLILVFNKSFRRMIVKFTKEQIESRTEVDVAARRAARRAGEAEENT